MLSRVYTLVSAFLIVLLAAGLGVSLYHLDRVTNLLERAEAKIAQQAKEIVDSKDKLQQAETQIADQRVRLGNLQSDLDQANRSISDLKGQVQSRDAQISDLKGDLSSANQTISDLKDRLPVRLTIVNEFGQPQYVGIDGVAFIYIRAGSSASFYIKPGSYNLMACHPTIMDALASCKRWGTYNLTYDRTLTISR